jgi:3-dehydroquinate synthase
MKFDSLEIQAEKSYLVEIGVDFCTEVKRISKIHNKVALFSPLANVIAQAKGLNIENLLVIEIPNGEIGKSFAEFEKALDYLGANQFTRSDAVIAIGGGATTDLIGFVAASWLRGIAWYGFPTSLAGMVDASVGGKTAINSKYGKNLVGAFHSPNYVGIDLTFLQTLPNRDLFAGMAEVIKSGFIGDPEILHLLAAHEQINSENFSDNIEVVAELIWRSLKVKAKYVSSDFKESKLREALNYGHTLGHAVEQYENYQLRHGEAIAIGLVYAAWLSHLELGLTVQTVKQHIALLEKYDLPTQYPISAFEELVELMKIDKKSRGNQIRFIGILEPGKVEWMEAISPENLLAGYQLMCKGDPS